jgi:hypothetical protein
MMQHRPCCNDACCSQDAKPTSQLDSLLVSSIIKTTPKVDFDVNDIQVSQDGQYVLLSGCSQVRAGARPAGPEPAAGAAAHSGHAAAAPPRLQVDDTAVVALVDVYGGQVDGRKGAGQVPSRLCSLHTADYQHYGSRPGLRVLQVGGPGAMLLPALGGSSPRRQAAAGGASHLRAPPAARRQAGRRQPARSTSCAHLAIRCTPIRLQTSTASPGASGARAAWQLRSFTHLLTRPTQQVTWHKHSPNHFAVLTSDDRFKLYHIGDLTLAEQTFHLRASEAARSFDRVATRASAAVRGAAGRAPAPSPGAALAPPHAAPLAPLCRAAVLRAGRRRAARRPSPRRV